MDVVASLLPSGAGRFLDFQWPDTAQQAGAAWNGGTRSRTGYGVAAPGTTVAIGGGGNPVSAVLNGVPGATMACTAAAGRQCLFYPGFPVWFRTSKSLISPLVDDRFVYRFVINIAGNGVAIAAGGDFGFELVQWNGAVATRIVADNAPGIGIVIQDANTAQLVVRGPNGLVVTNLTAAPFNTAALHCYDLRLISADPRLGTFPTLSLRIDNAPVALSLANSSWAPGTNLPTMALNGTAVGWVPTMVSSALNVNSLFVQQCHCIAAPTELMTL